MAQRGRNSSQEMNFDGLADSVTNLVGALILVVILVIGVTGEAVSQPTEKKSGGGTRNIMSLQQQLAAMRTQLTQVDEETNALTKKMETLRSEADQLFDRVDQLQPPAEQQPEASRKDAPRDVKFRPPFERLTTKDEISIWVEGKQASSNVPPGPTIMRDLKAAAEKLPQGTSPYEKSYDGFVFSCTILKDPSLVRAKDFTLVRAPNAQCETVEAAANAESLFQQALTQARPETHFVNFIVAADSFEAFRTLRELAYARGYEVNWLPRKAGQPFQFGFGAGKVQ